MKKRKNRKIFLQVVEPIALIALLLLFVIPILTVINLKPLVKPIPQKDVLGIINESDPNIYLVGGKHEVFREEVLNRLKPLLYSYSTQLVKRESSYYSKPILSVENRDSTKYTLSFSGQTISNTLSDISILTDKTQCILQSEQGDISVCNIDVNPYENLVVFLSVENSSPVLFSELFDMSIKLEPKEN